MKTRLIKSDFILLIKIRAVKSGADIKGKFKSYWTGTETYEALKVYIDPNFDGLKTAVVEMLSNLHCGIDPFTSQNDMTTFKNKDDVLTLLVHLGYLAYDEMAEEVFIPNQEIAQEFIRSVKAGGWEGLIQALSRSEELLERTWAHGITIGERICRCGISSEAERGTAGAVGRTEME